MKRHAWPSEIHCGRIIRAETVGRQTIYSLGLHHGEQDYYVTSRGFPVIQRSYATDPRTATSYKPDWEVPSKIATKDRIKIREANNMTDVRGALYRLTEFVESGKVRTWRGTRQLLSAEEWNRLESD